MKKIEKAVEKLKKYGYNARIENGCILIKYNGPKCIFQKVFENACGIAASTGYKNSLIIELDEQKE